MRRLLGIFLFLPSFAWAAPAFPMTDQRIADPIYQLFDDESDRMVINQIPLELDPVSLGFDVAAEERMKQFLNPAFIEEAMSAWLDSRVVSDLAGETIEPRLGARTEPTLAAPSLAVLMERARGFQKANLPSVAREELAYALRLYPKNKEISSALSDLSSLEFKAHMKEAFTASMEGQVDTAMRHVNQALLLEPKDAEALALKNKLIQQAKLKKQLGARVSQDYQIGVELYRAGKLDLALASFVRVLNLDPNHQGSLDYIKKIGERTKAGSR